MPTASRAGTLAPTTKAAPRACMVAYTIVGTSTCATGMGGGTPPIGFGEFCNETNADGSARRVSQVTQENGAASAIAVRFWHGRVRACVDRIAVRKRHSIETDAAVDRSRVWRRAIGGRCPRASGGGAAQRCRWRQRSWPNVSAASRKLDSHLEITLL